MNPQTFFLYLATWSMVALTPGPAVMFSMAQATRHGFRPSLMGIIGIQFGNFLFFVCIALGLGALLATATTAFTILRFVGAVYLLYLGTRIVFATLRRVPSGVASAVAPSTPHRHLFLHGLLIQLTNPKALLFISALLPQFIEPRRPVPWQLAILVAVTIAVDTVVLSSYAYIAQRGVHSYRASPWSVWFERAFGATLIFFGTRLLASRK